MSLHLADEPATLAAGARLGAALVEVESGRFPAAGLHVHLSGHLGAGKTTLVRGLLRGLGVVGAVKSPTYTLMEPYQACGLALYHFDLYRIGDPEELELIGARDLFVPGAVCLFEWPERGQDWLPAADLTLRLASEGEGRTLDPAYADGLGETLAAATIGQVIS